MTARMTLAPDADVALHVERDNLHIVRIKPPVRKPADPPPKQTAPPPGGKPVIRKPDTGDVWPTFVRMDPSPLHDDDLETAEVFESFESLAKRAPHAFGHAGQGARVFARVHAAGPASMTHIDEALAALPEDSELVVKVVWKDG